jgi:hypothetical protein
MEREKEEIAEKITVLNEKLELLKEKVVSSEGVQ